jgi:alpha-N-arabinofuranosidase
MSEEINHSYDGGLYAELIQNRIFRDDPSRPVHWYLVQEGGGTGSAALDQGQALNPYLVTSLRLDINNLEDNQRVGIANDGFWGIPVYPHTAYHFFCFAKGSGAFGKSYKGKLTVSLESSDGLTVFAQAVIPAISDGWQGYPATLTTGEVRPTADARLVISGDLPGKIWLNLVSLFPPTWNDRPNGNRRDLMQRLADLQPAFLRFPGGSYLVGNDVGSYFNWKKTLHFLNMRTGHPTPWNYRSSDGLGLLEYFEWCEDLQMEPVLALYAGFSLKAPVVKPGEPLEPFVQDALDEIEYLTGSESTLWGEKRVVDGHPKPFSLNFVEIGNEDWFDQSGSYEDRFAQFYDALKARYPKLQIIATTKVRSRVPDLLDEHFYRPIDKMLADLHHFDAYDRKGPRIMVGQWATTVGNPTATFGAALADAVWLIGLERNADIVAMQSYAPLFVNVNPGASQWGTNLIGFNALTNFVSPTYHVLKMFGTNHGNAVLATTSEGAVQLPSSVTRDQRKHLIYIKVVNPGNTPQALQIELTGVRIRQQGQSILLKSSSLDNTNTIDEPGRVAPELNNENDFGTSFSYLFVPYSVTVLILSEE